MCACVLKKTMSAVGKLIGDRDYVPCRGVLETSSSVTLKRLVLRKQRRNFFSRHVKGPYKYKVLDMSLGDDGVLVASGEPGGDPAASARSSLNDDTLFTEKHLAEYRHNSSTATASSAGVATLADAVNISVGLDTIASTSASLSYLKVSQIEGSNLERLIRELQSTWCFNKEHRLWECIRGQDKRELCFISSVVSTEKELTLQCKQNSSGGFMALVEKFIELSLEVSTTSSHHIVIPAGAAFAYKVQQLVMHPISGRITAPLGKMATPASEKFVILPQLKSEQETRQTDCHQNDDGAPIDPEKEIEDCRLYYSEFFGQLSREKQASLREALIKKCLSLDAALPTGQSLDEGQGPVQLESNSDVGNLPTGDATSKHRQRLARLKKMAKAALSTDAEPKEKEIADLLQELGVPGLLDLPKERGVAYGIRYFITALLQLSPEMLSLFRYYAADGDDGARREMVKKLEHLIENMADGTQCEILESPSLATAVGDDSFLYAWRAAYVAAIHMFGLPVE